MPAAFESETQTIFYRCVEDCNEPIMLTDNRGTLVYVNPAWCRIYGYAKGEALGQTPRLLRSPHQDDPFYESMWAQILDPNIGYWRGELVNRAKDGRMVPVILTITPYRATDGTITGYMGIALDLTDQKEMEMKILQQDRLASVGMLAGGLAHEVGTPLGVIRGRAEFLMMQLQEHTSAQKGLEIIVGQIDRISKLIRSLLRVSRTPEEVKLESVDVGRVISDVLALVGQSCRHHGIELVAEEERGVQVIADSNQLQQVLLNLIINATHAVQASMQQGRVGPHRIHIKMARHPKEISLSVVDTGCGIASENMKKLFQPFFTTKDIGEGTGLGLAIVAKLAQDMGGRISAESAGPGRGATFTIFLNPAE